MKLSYSGLLAGLAATALAEDLLFVDTFEYDEYYEATNTLGLTVKVVTVADWATMATADFAAFKAIVIADPDCSSDPSILQFLVDSKNTWGPAVQGNIVLIGTDPTYHDDGGEAGAVTLIDNAIRFAAAGVSATGASQTGLYFALSCYYQSVDTATVDALSYFGDFEVRGNLGCYNQVHIVASSPALATLDDDALSNWSCSVHEAFSVYPSVGTNGFQALAIAQNIFGVGSQTFGDETMGLPYIISRGATPAGCGNGIWEPAFGEECDDGSLNGNPTDLGGCSASCKCLSGRPDGAGHCLPPLGSSSSSSYSASGSPVRYANLTVTTTATVFSTTTFCPAPYVTPSPPTTRIVGVEVIVIIEIIESCTTIGESTITSYITSECSTISKPIWNVETSGSPCYVCELSKEGKPCPSSKFITASVTSCLSPPPSYTTPAPVIVSCSTCVPFTLSTCPASTYPTTTATTKTTVASASTTIKSTATVLPFTGAAGKVDFGLGIMGAAFLVVAAAL